MNKPKITTFWKILFWFWLSTTLIIFINIFINQINSEKIHFRLLPEPVENELKLINEKTQKAFSLIDFSHRVSTKRFKNIFLIDENSQDYFQRPIPEVLADLNARVIRDSHNLSAFQKRQAFFGGSLIKINNKNYRLYVLKTDSFLNRHFIGGFFRDLAQSLLVSIFIISFPISFFLSWLITKPIKQLQQSTKDIQNNVADHHNLKQLLNRSDEFGDLARDFSLMNQHITQTLNSQKQLLSDVSHELRSPLSRLKIAIGMVEQKNITTIEKDINRIKLESNRMNEMLESLLTLSKLESQEISSPKEKLDLCALINSVIENGRYEAEQLNVEIQLNMPNQFEFNGSKESLMSGIENILRNAIKYTGENGQIICCLEQINDKLIFSITDNGPGVPSEQLDKLFDAFYRPEFARARDSGGIGLGLSIAKRAFAINGGEIFAENVLPNGLKVSVVFNLF